MSRDKSAIILAGGKGSRLGYVDKAFLMYNGRFFIDILIEKLTDFKEVIVVTNSPEKYTKYVKDYKYSNNIKIVTDKIKNIGPIGGIYTGLLTSKYDENFILSCDTPFISEEFIKYMKELSGDYLIAVPTHEANMEPLCAIYKKGIIKKIEKSIEEKNYRVNSIFNESHVKRIELENFLDKEMIIKRFYNVNTDYELKNINQIEKNK
ncbi:MAG: molybdenum cofactor guanylyltransferase [Fusobacteriaceae bacterium]